MIVTELEIE